MQERNKASTEVEGKIKSRTATHNIEVSSEISEVTPYFELKKQPSNSAITKKVFAYWGEKKWKEAGEYLNSAVPPQRAESFYSKEGMIFCSWAVIHAPSVEPLKSLINHGSNNIIIELLNKDRFSILRGFLGCQDTLEASSRPEQQPSEVAVEKLETILKLNNEEIKQFITEHSPSKIKLTLKL